MPTLTITRVTHVPELPLSHMGVRMNLSVTSGGPEPTVAERHSSSSSAVRFVSSSSQVEVQISSSSWAPSFHNIFLYRELGGREYFLGVCSPADLDAWLPDEPDSLRTELWSDIQDLMDALDVVSAMRGSETVSYSFSTSDARLGIGGSSSSSAHGVRRFTLTRESLVAYPTTDPVGYRLNVACVAEGADPKIFLYRDDLPDRDRVTHSRPIAVCSPGDLVDYPEDEADSRHFPAFYRQATFDIVSRDLALLQETWANVKRDTEELAAALQWHQDEVTSVEEVAASYDA
jgi:hypothetical protein